MKTQIIYDDVDGNLIQIYDQPPHYAKELSLETAWHIDQPENIHYLQEEFIQSTSLHFHEKRLEIHYNPEANPLNLEQLRSLLAPNTQFYHWRFIRLAIDLCEHLKELHTAELPQPVIHPGRIAAINNRFILLPTLAGVMPPFDQLKSREDSCWLHFIAPEALRTRGNIVDMLFTADIYALGWTLYALALCDWQPHKIDNPLSFINTKVETSYRELPMEWPQDFPPLKPIINKMCAFFPEDRPTLEELSVIFKETLKQYMPDSIIQGLINEKQLDKASSCLQVLRDGQSSPLFAIPPQRLYKLEAQFHLAQSPPDYGQAIGCFQKVLTYEPNSIDIHIEIGQTYWNYHSHSQHLLLCAEAYETVGELTEWREDIVLRIMEVLSKLNNPSALVKITNRIPAHKRPKKVYSMRAESFMAIGHYMSCWLETFEFFKIYGSEDKMNNLAQKAASFIEPLDLLRWYYQVENKENISNAKISFSIVWQRNQNIEKAQQCLEEVLGKKFNQGG